MYFWSCQSHSDNYLSLGKFENFPKNKAVDGSVLFIYPEKK